MRESKSKWSHVMISWVPHTGKRGKGRPKTCWADEISKEFGNNWRRKAADRQTWKGLVEAHA